MITIGVDLGGTKTLVAAFGADGELLGQERHATEPERGSAAVLDAIAAAVRRLDAAHGAATAIGVGFAGLVDSDRGLVDSSVIVPGFDQVALATLLEARLSRPVRLENDATAAGHGEFVALGRRRDRDLLVITVGTGIGGAVVLGGRLLRGASGTAGEFGNMSIDWNGTEHACGNRGCLNTLASGPAILARATALAAAEPSRGAAPAFQQLADVGAAAALGDAAAIAAIEYGARALGTGIANLVMAFNPHRISLMGGVLGLGDAWFDAVVDEARRRSFPRAAAVLDIDRCRLGEITGAFGAAMLSQEALQR